MQADIQCKENLGDDTQQPRAQQMEIHFLNALRSLLIR